MPSAMTPRVSVVIPAFNALSTIDFAVFSALRQEDVAVEIIIASDDHIDYLAQLARQGVEDERLRMIRTPTMRSGAGIARTAAAREATGDFIATLDADDAFAPGRLAKLVALAAKGGAAVDNTAMTSTDGSLIRTAFSVDSDDRTLTTYDLLSPRIPFAPVFHRSLLGDGWPDLPFAEDVVFNLTLLAKATDMRILLEPGYLYAHRPGSLSHSADTPNRAHDAYEMILNRLDHDAFGLPRKMAAAARRQFSDDMRTNTVFASKMSSGEVRDLADFLSLGNRVTP
ncbi:glycosyltransferase family 2 protein [Fodinicurvata sp. EGI_FJ10296]|uniref:glycosyltransferase family 2 protein n=1 Tax=Fodinicurvata sp. EGI_FJ10296 TaxID=3231908 RepID=UPI003454E804